VFSSTCTVHGPPASLPIVEDMPYAPISPYGRSKAMVEQILADSVAASGLAAVALRYFNACGADPDGEVGEAHDPETHLIPLVLAAARDGTGVTLNGDNYPTPDGTCVRDYIHVSDLANAHVLALDALTRPGEFRAYNLGTGEGFSVRQIIDAARDVTGKEIAVRIGSRRAGDPPSLFADPRRAAAELAFHPTLSGLTTIMDSAWNWTIRPPGYAAP
jgi:UDP-glucose-4-epimerase GalE